MFIMFTNILIFAFTGLVFDPDTDFLVKKPKKKNGLQKQNWQLNSHFVYVILWMAMC